MKIFVKGSSGFVGGRILGRRAPRGPGTPLRPLGARGDLRRPVVEPRPEP